MMPAIQPARGGQRRIASSSSSCNAPHRAPSARWAHWPNSAALRSPMAIVPRQGTRSSPLSSKA
eukprot:262005-Lingulodinium_polyedra.AAC.1